MRTAIAQLKSVSPYGQSKAIQSVKPRDESYDDFEKRVWRERAHVDADGIMFIPPMAFKNCIAEAAKYKSIKVPGKGGKVTYTKHFEAGVMCVEPFSLGVRVEDLKPLRLFVPVNGQRGGKSRVYKNFPVVQSWGGEVPFMVLDDIIGEEIFEQHLVDAGQFIGIGFFRPRNNGYFGRFSVEGVRWE